MSPGGTCTHWKAPPCHGAPLMTVIASEATQSAGALRRGAGVARQIDEFEDRAVGVVEIGARAIDDTALAVLLEGDLDAVLAEMIERRLVLVMRNAEGMVHPAMVLAVRIDRRIALDQDEAGPGRVEKRHP